MSTQITHPVVNIGGKLYMALRVVPSGTNGQYKEATLQDINEERLMNEGKQPMQKNVHPVINVNGKLYMVLHVQNVGNGKYKEYK